MTERRLVGGPLDGSRASVPEPSEGVQLLVLVQGVWHAYRLAPTEPGGEEAGLAYAGEVADLPRLGEDDPTG